MTMAANMKGFTKRTWVLGLLAAGSLLSAQAQADQLADIKAAGVVKVVRLTPTRRLALLMPKRTRSSDMTWTSPKRWQNRSA